MLTIFRRHTRTCPSRSKGRQWKRCKCPIHAEGRIWAGADYTRMALKTNVWELAQEMTRRWDAQGFIDEVGPGSGKPGAKDGVTIEEACRQWLDDAAARNLAPSTQKKYRVLTEQIVEWCDRHGTSHVTELDVVALRDFRSSWQDSPISSNKKLERLRSLFRFAVASGWLTANPALALKRAVEDQAPTLPMSDANLAKIIAASDPRSALLWSVMRHSGLRISDAVQLKPADLDDEGRLILNTTTKTDAPVRVLLPSDLAVKLGDLTPNACGLWFWNRRDANARVETACGNARRIFNRLLRQTGLSKEGDVEKDHFHRLRDAFATDLLSEGTPIEVVSKLLGHKSVRVTEKHYSPWVKARQDAADQALRKVHSKRSDTKEKLILIKAEKTA